MSDCIQFTEQPMETAYGLRVPDFYFYDELRENWSGIIFDDRVKDWLRASEFVWNTKYTRRGQVEFEGRKRGEPFIIGWRETRDGTWQLKLINAKNPKKFLKIVVRNPGDASALPKFNQKLQELPTTLLSYNMPPVKDVHNPECKYGVKCRNLHSNPQHAVEYTHGGDRNVQAHSAMCQYGLTCVEKNNPHHAYAYSH